MATIEKVETLTLPIVALRSIVAFPAVTINFECTEDSALSAVNAATETDSYVLLLSKKNTAGTDSPEDSLYKIGTVAKIKQSIKTPEGNIRIIAEGLCRAEAVSIRTFGTHLTAEAVCRKISLSDGGGIRAEAMIEQAQKLLEEMTSFMPAPSDELRARAKTIRNPGLLADFIAANVLVKHEDKQTILERFEPMKRLMELLKIMESEIQLLECEKEIHKNVRARLAQNQREYYLREELKVIREELGTDEGSEADEYFDRIMKAKLPEEVREKLLKENERLAKTPFGSAEAGVLRTYLDTCLELPWCKSTKDRVSVSAAEKILNSDHDGLQKVKERILEFLAVKQLNPQLKNQIICLVGPPGVGKTSVASSIARAMNRKYVRVSLGGVRDEADIRGHRKTYIGAMPGRIINAINQAKVKNPLILLDEIDKLTSDAHGDPASALLEVLDSEQNSNFRDHFIELPFDLSECVFIATANTLDTVPRPLIDRMEIIELKTYTRMEKVQIAKHHLIPKQLKRHGLTKKQLTLSEGAILEIIDFYTREAGVRNLERTIADLCRKAAKKLLTEEGISAVKITDKNVSEYLGARKLLPDRIAESDEVGTVNGLAFTEVGGDMLKIEASVLEGSGKIELTGSLGDVMKESAQLAVSYVRSITGEYQIEKDFYKTKDIHIHCPEGAVPKDGPSAGVTMTTALVSALTGIPVKRDVAMTGEITLRGNVLPIGGLKEKTMAAYSAGVKTVFIPADNMRELPDIDPVARENLKFIPCRRIEDVLSGALRK
ncbi:MAG: endopeptidase La [Clostridia bacterium]|nr:endopeptidase La [Clostridia bacterium]